MAINGVGCKPEDKAHLVPSRFLCSSISGYEFASTSATGYKEGLKGAYRYEGSAYEPMVGVWPLGALALRMLLKRRVSNKATVALGV